MLALAVAAPSSNALTVLASAAPNHMRAGPCSWQAHRLRQQALQAGGIQAQLYQVLQPIVHHITPKHSQLRRRWVERRERVGGCISIACHP